MKKHTTIKSKFSSAFSLVELLVVIAVIAIIAAIAIPNISGITGSATTAASQRNAQNLASLAAAARAAGYTNEVLNEGTWITNLMTGITVTNLAGQVFGPFKADGLPASAASFGPYLTLRTNGTMTVLAYDASGASTP